MLDNEAMWVQLEADGYIVIPNVVDAVAVDKAMRVINRSLGAHMPIRESMCPDCGGKKEITDLLKSSTLTGILATLLGPYSGGGGAQIALRFPGDNTDENFNVYPNWADHWHIDGLSTPNSTRMNSIPTGDIHNFTALVGVLLQDVPAEDMGNLTLYPGSHFELQNYFRAVGFDDVLARGTDALPKKMKFSRPPKQICGRAGDVVIVNYMTAHLVAPNSSSSIRYCVYFRLKGAGFAENAAGRKHRPDSMLDAWKDWPGLAKAKKLIEWKEQEQLKMAIKESARAVTAIATPMIEPSDEDEELKKVLERSKNEY